MSRRWWLPMLSAGLVAWGVSTATPAAACPSCRAANATNPNLPMAYQTSILFMLTVPALIMTGFGVGLYRLNKAQEEATAAFENGEAWEG